MTRIRHLLGLPAAEPSEPAYTDEDVAAAGSLRRFLEAGFSERSIEEITRVLGESMARVTASTAAAFAETFLEPGDIEHDVAWRFAAAAEELAPSLVPVLAAAFRSHLRENARLGMIRLDELAAGQLVGDRELGVCFADLVGFTRLGGEVEPGELEGVAGVFAQLAAEVAGRRVRLVKTIGDAAMFASSDPERLVAAALDLLELSEQAELPSLRAGVAFGATVPRAGDLYGPTVNLASRVTGAARPRSVLCTQEVRDAAPEAFDWSYAHRFRLKGIGDAVPLYRARRLEPREARAGEPD